MALPYRLMQAVLGEYAQLQKLGLINKASSNPFKFYATSAVDTYGQKKSDWLDNWGPYLFGWGLFLFLLQKEILVVEHELKHYPPMIILTFLVYKLWGAKIHKWAEDLQYKDQLEKDASIDNAKKEYADAIQAEKMYQDCYPDIVKNIAEAKRENVGLQLEAAYRGRLQSAFQEVKRRADYLAESEETKRRFEQRHMVNWIVDQVRKSITAQQEQDYLRQCISDLKRMGA